MYEQNYLASRLRKGSLGLEDKVFITAPEFNIKVSYSEFFKDCEKLASVLEAGGVSTGDRVLYYAPKTIAGLELFIACLLIGAVYVQANPDYDEDDLAYFIDDTDPKVVVCSDSSLPTVNAVVSVADRSKVYTVNTGETGSLIDARSKATAKPQVVGCKEEDAAAILYTSGTTGRPKGVVHTHLSLASNAEVLAEYWHFSSDDVLIHSLPIFHLHGLFTATNVALISGCSMVYFSGFKVEQIMEALPHSSVLMGVPPFYVKLLQQKGLSDAAKNMRLFLSGSAPMLPQVHAQWRAATGRMILERYGMTEGSMIASNPYFLERRPNSVGFPLPGIDIRIVDSDGHVLGPNDIGFIEIKGNNLFSGYWNLPKKTAEEMTSDGYFISGDYGMFDEDGYLYVVGRVKDAITTSLGVVFPKDVEVKIDAVPGVLESAVIAVPKGGSFQGPVAVVVRSPGSTVGGIEIIEGIENLLTPCQMPEKIIFVDRLPRNVMGKVQKVVLRKQFEGVLSEEGIV